MKKTIPALLNYACEQFGHAPYMHEKTDAGWVPTSYVEARDLAKSLAAALLSRNLKGNIAIISEGRPQWVISEIGILLTGGTTVPLSMKLLPDEIPFRVNHSESVAVIFSRNITEKLVSVYSQLEKKPVLISLDRDSELLADIAKRTGTKPGTTLLNYPDLIEEGQAARRITEVEAQLAQIEDAIQPDDTATICYTSGTTGNPKGAMLSHRNFNVNVHQATGKFYLRYGLKTLVILPVDHSYAHTIALYASLLRKFSLYFVDARGGSMSILRNIPINLVEVKPDFLLTVPSLTQNFMNKILAGIRAKGEGIEKLFQKALAAKIKSIGTAWERPNIFVRFGLFFQWALAALLIFPKLRKVFGGKLEFTISGGAYLDIYQQQFFKAIGITVYQGYGLTEASPVISTNSKELHKIGTAGTVLPDMEVRIIDDAGKDLPRGQKGQIIVRGENVMKGYFKNPKATSEAIHDGWLHSGDLGTLDEDNFLSVMGREKALLIANDGEKYSPEEIEEAIVNTSTMISQCMLYCDHKPFVTSLIYLDPELVKYTIEKKKPKDAAELLELVRQEFNSYISAPSYKDKFPKVWTPKTFAIIPEPFTEANKMINSTLKLVRHKVLENYRELIEYTYTREGEVPASPRNIEFLTKEYFS